MKGVKEVKARLKSVGNIKKITSTMELVAAAKMKKLQDRALASRPYGEAIEAMIAQVAEHAPADASPLLVKPEKIERECVVVVGADKGLCGAFNANLHRAALKHIRASTEAGLEVCVQTIGRRPGGFFKKIGADIFGHLDEAVEKIDYRITASVMQSLVQDYLEGKIQKITLVYTWLRSAMAFDPIVVPLLPFADKAATDEADEGEAAADGTALDYIMEPSPAKILEQLLPKSLEVKLYAAVMESLASEFASRRMAMKNATDAATDMIGELTMEYNKARQAGITGELLEIVAGAEALAG